jgi:P-type conjugative transfer protein TrbG
MKITKLSAAIIFTALSMPLANASSLEEKFFTNENPTLTQTEKSALAIAKKWTDGGATGMRPFDGGSGAVVFAFGAQQPSILCAVLQVCDVALQAGEQVNSINLGDSARWIIEPAITGSGSGEVQHLIIKPLDVGLETSLVVTTDRRTYHLKLRSHRTEYMPQVAFSYPEDAAAKFQALQARNIKERSDNTIPKTGEYLGDLSFDYTVSGNANWKPVRVFNDGRKTIIQMPKSVEHNEAPTLLVVGRKTSIFKKPENVIVNYRMQRDRYIVDSLFDKAILVSGVGRSQEKITIEKGE